MGVWQPAVPTREKFDLERQQALPMALLDAMRQLARGGMTMVVVTHELGFARDVADRVLFMDRGRVVELNDASSFFNHAREERSRRFLSQMQH